MDQHHAEIKQISASVKRFCDQKQKFCIFHGSTNSTRNKALHDNSNVVDTSRLNHVLSIDTEKKIATVEPNVPMDRLVEACLAYDLIPPVVMDFPGTTAGGGFSGASGESSSFKHGFFDRTVNSAEFILANGEVVTCSDKEHEDLFHGAAGALGTLGVVTLLELQLERAYKFVEVSYIPVAGAEEAVQKCRELADLNGQGKAFDYVDGVILSKTSGVVVTGCHTDDAGGLPIQRFSSARDPWYFMHVQEAVSKGKVVKECIPTPEYLFRYDRGGFWVGQATFNTLGLPFNSFTRWLFDPWLHIRMLYKSMDAQPFNGMIIQDLALPYKTANDFIEYVDSSLGVYPLWLCPLRQSPLPTMHLHSADFEGKGKSQTPKQMLNIGVWGVSKTTKSLDSWIDTNTELCKKLQELGGMKWLYANNL